MLEDIIANNENLKNADVVAICMYKNKLCIVPCDDAQSGIYPRYKEAVKISDKEIINFPNKIDGQSIDAIIIDIDDGKYEIDFAEDSWDGFQPLGDL